mmetsp:Transcript_16651/g.52191  ORF Transcript_16651/g.52191 Transcript_16651/m.52191 type:complete len:340 (-) Transcript_16651:454-1473(-)|eukprot:CAMPEP_0182861240 /NCGR_PEP_ID=MMETSP0034_2-20130328/5381_1 /TAXON_ID=156128 /ORGANISM="Nephroselmis pyriformis, Strain CCMP717" /LENGTH=339 /DNA_ID=CAMNT_0024993149 /DNA_START=380 /DNA_END=1399 /DNA_ORIENTATION=+
MNTDPFRMSRDENSPMEMGKTPDSGGIYLSRPVTRPPLGEVQRNLSSAAFGASPTLLKSPVETVTPPGPQMGEMRNSMGLSGEWQKLVNIVTWEDRHKSAVYFAAGNAMFLTASILSLDGVLPCTPLTMAAYCLIIHLFVNFMKATVKGAPVSPSPLKPQEIQYLAERLGKVVNYAAARHNELFEGSNPFLTLEVAVSLWAVATLGAWFSFFTLSVISFELAFILPYVYGEYTQEIDGAVSRASKEWEWRWRALGLTRGQKISSGVFFTLAAIWFVNTATVCFGVFCGLLMLRIHMEPQSFDSGVHMVKKTGRRITMGASDLGRSMLSPFSHVKGPKCN